MILFKRFIISKHFTFFTPPPPPPKFYSKHYFKPVQRPNKNLSTKVQLETKLVNVLNKPKELNISILVTLNNVSKAKKAG